MSTKIVVLNSGGFDSVVLMNDVANYYEPEADIYSLHFKYSAPNEVQQLKCVENVCKKVGAKNVIINLPKFAWTKNDFYSKGDNVYVEGRNLVFISYAISYAESIGADKIYLAVLKSWGYTDTSTEFLTNVYNIAKQYGIEIVFPYSDFTKENLFHLATLYSIRYEDFFTCDTPSENGEPCHKCSDCTLLDDFYKNDSLVKAFTRNGYTVDNEEFSNMLKTSDINELRVLINNDCQLRCSHCFYGFNEMKSEALSPDEMKRVIREAKQLGVRNFHFSGKEPLYDDLIFEYARFIRNNFPTCTYDVVTNGINVPKYARRLKEEGFRKVYLSVDNVLSENGVRSVGAKIALNALEALMDNDIPIEIFIDLHKNNYSKVYDILYSMKRYGFKSVYVRTIKPVGNAKDFELLDIQDINDVFLSLEKFAEENKDITVMFDIGCEYANLLRESNTALGEALFILENSFSACWFRNLFVFAEIYCARYERTITVTPDGYLLGCATEVSSPNYDKLSVGNVRYNSLKDLVIKGRELSLETQCKVCIKNDLYCLNKCPYTLI